MTDLDKLEALAKGAIEGWSGSRVIGRSDAATILDLIASARRDAEEIERLRAALAFYADESDWDEYRSDTLASVHDRDFGSKLGNDVGAVARAARAAHTGEG